MIAAGAEHTAAVTEDGDLYGWGWGRYGNLGLGDRDDRLIPEKVSSVNVSNLTLGCLWLLLQLSFMFYIIIFFMEKFYGTQRKYK